MLHKKEVAEAQRTDHLEKYDANKKLRVRLREQAKVLGMTVQEYKAIYLKKATL